MDSAAGTGESGEAGFKNAFEGNSSGSILLSPQPEHRVQSTIKTIINVVNDFFFILQSSHYIYTQCVAGK